MINDFRGGGTKNIQFIGTIVRDFHRLDERNRKALDSVFFNILTVNKKAGMSRKRLLKLKILGDLFRSSRRGEENHVPVEC